MTGENRKENKKTPFEQIRNSIEMTALVRAVVTDNPDYISFMDLKEEEYEQFVGMYFQKPYEAIRAMNSFMKRMKKDNALVRHIASAVDLECIVESDVLERTIGKDNESPVISGIKGYLMQGYTEMGADWRNEGRTGQEKFRIDKAKIADILIACKTIAIEEPDEETAARKIAYFAASILNYNQNKVDKIWAKERDKTVMFSRFVKEEAGVCRHEEALCQLGLQEAGIYSRMTFGVDFKAKAGHTWKMADIGDKIALIDCSVNPPLFFCGNDANECYKKAIDIGWLGIKEGNGIFEIMDEDCHYYKYSTRGLPE